jgi:hypothetical protein
LAATLIYTVIGRVVALVVLEGRAWDTGLENLWVHIDFDGLIDWAGVVDPTVRALPDDPYFARADGDSVRDGVVWVPSEAALTTWVAHRLSPHAGILVRQAVHGQRWRGFDRDDVAHRRICGGHGRDPGNTAGRQR